MGLKDLIDDEKGDSKEEESTPCPACGSEETEDVKYYHRCHNTSCPVITFITTDYTEEPA